MKIPLIFEKTGWWVVALLAVSKAGAAFVPVDAAQPLLRLKEIIHDVKPQFLISSSQYAGLLADSVETVIVVSRDTMQWLSLKTTSPVSLPKVSSTEVAYVMVSSSLPMLSDCDILDQYPVRVD